MPVHTKKLNAYTVYLIYSGASALFLGIIFTVNLVYQIQVAHLTPLQLVLVGTVLEIVCFCCQVPTGVLADVYSRRLAVIVGIVVLGAGFILEGSIPSFPFILLSQVLCGLGVTLTDGAEQAWITGELGEDAVGHAFIRGTQAGLVGGLVGAFAGVGLASVRLNLPVVLGGALMIILAAFLLLVMPENGFQPTPKQERQSWREMRNALRTGLRLVRRSSVLLTLFSIELFYGLSSEGYDRLATAHFLADFTFPALGSLKPVVWFAIFSVGETLLSLFVTELVKRRFDANNARLVVMTLLIMNALNVLSILVFALTGNFFLAVAAYLASGVFSSAGRPLLLTWFTRNTEAKSRATVISMLGQVNALGQIVGGPPVGYIGTVISLRVALTTVSAILSPVLPLFAYAFHRAKVERAALIGESTEPVARK